MTTNQPTNTEPDTATCGTDDPFPQHPFAEIPAELADYYHRRLRTGFTSIRDLTKAGRDAAFGNDPIQVAKTALADMDNAAGTIKNLNLAQAREMLASLHSEARETLADEIHRTVHETQTEYSDPCDDPTCYFANLTTEERNARSALQWLATLQEATGDTSAPAPQPTSQTQHALRRVLDDLLASGRYPHINESVAELLDATNAAVDGAEHPSLNENPREEDDNEDDDNEDDEDWDDLPRPSGPEETTRERLADAIHELAHHVVRADPVQLVQADTSAPDGLCTLDNCSTQNTIVYAFRVRQRRFRPHTSLQQPEPDQRLPVRPSAQDSGADAPADPESQAADEFGTHMPYYQRGRAWVRELVTAAHNTVTGAAESGRQNELEADRILDPLIHVVDPERLRDFIAGAARRAEDHITDLRATHT